MKYLEINFLNGMFLILIILVFCFIFLSLKYEFIKNSFNFIFTMKRKIVEISLKNDFFGIVLLGRFHYMTC